MSVRNRRRSPARRPPFKLPKRRILLVVEGAVTEKNYFEGMIAALRTTVVEFKVLGGVGVPMTIVETALKIRRAARERARVEKDQYLDYDETWCVFDVDQHPKIPEAVKLAEVRFWESAALGLNNATTYQSDALEVMGRDIGGILAELVVGRKFDRTYLPAMNTFHKQADVGEDIEVRSTPHLNGSLILRDNDDRDPERRYKMAYIARGTECGCSVAMTAVSMSGRMTL